MKDLCHRGTTCDKHNQGNKTGHNGWKVRKLKKKKKIGGGGVRSHPPPPPPLRTGLETYLDIIIQIFNELGKLAKDSPLTRLVPRMGSLFQPQGSAEVMASNGIVRMLQCFSIMLGTMKSYSSIYFCLWMKQYAVKGKRHRPSVVVDPRNVVHAL